MIRTRGDAVKRLSKLDTIGKYDQWVASSRPIIVLVCCFSVIFAGIVGLKLHEEWKAERASAEASQARAAAFQAERVAGRLMQINGAIAMARAELSATNRSLSAQASQSVRILSDTPWVNSAALLLPRNQIITSQNASATLMREAAERALSNSTGIAALTKDRPAIAIAKPVELASGSVGALVVVIDPVSLISASSDPSLIMLADNLGHLLAIQPNSPFDGAPLIGERLGLTQQYVASLATNGGAVDGVNLAETPHILGAAPISGAPLSILILSPAIVNEQAWKETLIFHALLFLAPLGTALTLLIALNNQMSRLKKTRVQLQDSEGQLRLAITGARCGVFEWDLDSDDVVLTDSFASLVGRSGAEIMSGPEFLLLLRSEDRVVMRAALRGSADTNDIDVEVRAASLPVWMQMRGSPKYGTSRIIGIAIDITERKGAQARVAAAENRLRAALESMSESFVLWDAKKRLVLWNPKFAEFFGLKNGELRPGINYEVVEAVARKAIAKIHGVAKSNTGHDNRSAPYDIELTDGRWLKYSERPTADGGLVSFGTDITAMKSQETALKENDKNLRRTVENLRLSQERVQELAKNYEEEKIRAEEANRSKSEFLANMSHELRTPLNAINGFSEIMADELFGPIGDERYADYVKDILGSGQHLLSLINDILDMSKIEAGKMSLQPETIAPTELVEQSIRIMRARADEKQIKLVVEFEDVPEIEADPRAIKQVLLNLLSNAVKFTPESGRITVRGFNANDGVVLQVADTGIGVAKEDLPRLGRPFEQIENQHSKSYQGSGLGLALSKSLVEMHGGSLRIDSVLGQGTTVSFCLPLVAELSDPTDQPAYTSAHNEDLTHNEIPMN